MEGPGSPDAPPWGRMKKDELGNGHCVSPGAQHHGIWHRMAKR